jgi:hypothetical protein
MPPTPLALLVLAAEISSPVRSVEVRSGAGRLDVQARGALVPHVLDEIARQTGMRVLYEGDVGAARLTATVAGAPADVVLRLVGSAGFGCVLQLAGDGRAVRTVVVAARAAAGVAPMVAAPPTADTRVHVRDVLPTDPGYRVERLDFERGQPIHWKVVVTDQDDRPVPAAQVEAELVAPDRRVVGSLSAMTGTDGAALFAHTLDAVPLPGTYTIRVRGLAPEAADAAYDPLLDLRSATTISIE